MKVFFLLALFLAGCVTTGSGSEAKYSAGSCLKLTEAALKKYPPQAQAVLSFVELKVVDVDADYYVIEQRQNGFLQNRAAVKFVEAESETTEAPCAKTKAPQLKK